MIFSKETICLTSSKHSDLSTECLNSSERQLKACSAVLFHSFVIALVLVLHDDVAGSVCEEHAQFMYVMNRTKCDNHESGNGRRSILYGCKTIAMTSWIHMRYALWDTHDADNEGLIKQYANVWTRMRGILWEWFDPLFGISKLKCGYFWEPAS